MWWMVLTCNKIWGSLGSSTQFHSPSTLITPQSSDFLQKISIWFLNPLLRSYYLMVFKLLQDRKLPAYHSCFQLQSLLQRVPSREHSPCTNRQPDPNQVLVSQRKNCEIRKLFRVQPLQGRDHLSCCFCLRKLSCLRSAATYIHTTVFSCLE